MASVLKVNGSRLIGSIKELGEIGRTPDGGVSRLAMSPADIEGKKYVKELMSRAGLASRFDPVTNLIGTLEGSVRGHSVISGSHTDSVINGGKLDGCYGVLSAIEAARTIRESGTRLNRSLVVVSFTNEEGLRFPPFIGSKFFSGKMSLEEARSLKEANGDTFGEAVDRSSLPMGQGPSVGLNPESFVELHIEQGPVLEQSHIDIGIVQSIVGIRQYDVSVTGVADHAGTTPMIVRRDALISSAKMMLGVNNLAKELGHGCVATVGRIQVSPGAPNVVPGSSQFTIDFRSISQEILSRGEVRIGKLTKRVSKEDGLEIRVEPRLKVDPTPMSKRVAGLVEGAAHSLGLSSAPIQSGAGHDTMVMSGVTRTGMIFVPSKGGKSHNPYEASSDEDLVNGANVLANTMAKLAA